MTKKRIILSFLGLLLTISTIQSQAADARFCDQYARTSIQQQVANIAHECGKTGLRWSPLYKGQKDWCMTIRQAIPEAETQARNTALQSCGTTAAPINWNSLGDPSKWDALFAQEMIAIERDDAVSIQVMHEHGVNINHDEGFNNGTALYHAIDQQAEKVAHYLVQQGVNPDRTTNGGLNPLIRMVEDATVNLSLLQYLLNNGADPNSFGEYGAPYTPLQVAIEKNHLPAATVLLNSGANPNTFDQTPILINAIKKRNLRAVVLLVNRGANVNMGEGISKEGCTKNTPDGSMPLDTAIRTGFNSVITLLRNRGAKTAAECRAG